MKRFRLGSVALLAVAMSSSALLSQPALAQDAAVKPAITGTMQIDFTTRLSQNQEDGAPKKGV